MITQRGTSNGHWSQWVPPPPPRVPNKVPPLHPTRRPSVSPQSPFLRAPRVVSRQEDGRRPCPLPPGQTLHFWPTCPGPGPALWRTQDSPTAGRAPPSRGRGVPRNNGVAQQNTSPGGPPADLLQPRSRSSFPRSQVGSQVLGWVLAVTSSIPSFPPAPGTGLGVSTPRRAWGNCSEENTRTFPQQQAALGLNLCPESTRRAHDTGPQRPEPWLARGAPQGSAGGRWLGCVCWGERSGGWGLP